MAGVRRLDVPRSGTAHSGKIGNPSLFLELQESLC